MLIALQSRYKVSSEHLATPEQIKSHDNGKINQSTSPFFMLVFSSYWIF